MPRPKRFAESHTPDEIAELYREGMSTRELERLVGASTRYPKAHLSRWVVTACAVERGVEMRSKDEALGRQRYFASIEADRVEAVRCVWPGCALACDSDTKLCLGHDMDLAEAVAEGARRCLFPPVCYERPMAGAGLCWYHERKVKGEISG